METTNKQRKGMPIPATIRVCSLASLYAFALLMLVPPRNTMAQTVMDAQSEYIYETPEIPVYNEIMRDFEKRDYTKLYRYVARKMHKPMKELAFIPLFDTEPSDISTPSSFVLGLKVREEYMLNNSLLQDFIRFRWKPFDGLEKWKHPRNLRLRKQFPLVESVAVYSQDGTFLNDFSVYAGGFDKYVGGWVESLDICPSAKFFLRIDNSLWWYLYCEDAYHYAIITDNECVPYDTLYKRILQPKKERIERTAAENVATKRSYLSSSME